MQNNSTKFTKCSEQPELKIIKHWKAKGKKSQEEEKEKNE